MSIAALFLGSNDNVSAIIVAFHQNEEMNAVALLESNLDFSHSDEGEKSEDDDCNDVLEGGLDDLGI